MKLTAIAVGLLAFAGQGAFAQDLPTFDADAGYRVRAVLSEQRLLLDNDGTDFICEIDYQSDRAIIGDCLPLLVAANDPPVMATAPDLDARVASATASIQSLDPGFTAMSITQFFNENNCQADISNMPAFEEILIQFIAESFALDDDVIPHVHDPIYDSIDDAMELMMSEGRVVISADGASVLYDGCN